MEPSLHQPDGETRRIGHAGPLNTGNPRITVAFPFSNIKINQPTAELSALTALLLRLAEHTAVVARQVDAEQADAIDALADEVSALLGQID